MSRSTIRQIARWRQIKPELSRRLDVLRPFDPWSSPMCSCPPKLSLDVYCGCGYECVYCYVSAYNRRCWGREKVRPKKDLLRRLERDLRRIAERDDLWILQELPVALSNSSDPYPAAPHADEEELELTRRALALLADHVFPVLVTTKSPLVVRDIDLLARMRCVIAITITTIDEDLASRLEPYAPLPSQRLSALSQLSAHLPTICRVDPLIPYINAEEEGIVALLDALAEAGVRRVICSTYKHKPDNFRRLSAVFPKQAAELAELLNRSQRISGYYYLRREVREQLLANVREMAHERGISVTVCREGIPWLSDGTCDGRDLAGLSVGESDRPEPNPYPTDACSVGKAKEVDCR